MLQQLLTFLPHKLGSVALIICAIGTLIGLILWMTGARYSRSILTIAAVGLGTIIGLKLPHWCNWSVDPMGPAVGGAFLLGISAFALHRLWVGAWLGVLLSAWAALAIWTLKAQGANWVWPPHAGRMLPQYLSDIWHTLPLPLQRYLPLCAAACMAIGMASAIVWPRVGTLVMWSIAGISLVMTGSVAIAQMRPGSLGHLPRQMPTQFAVLAGLVGFGALLQWRFTPLPKSAGPDHRAKKSDKKGD